MVTALLLALGLMVWPSSPPRLHTRLPPSTRRRLTVMPSTTRMAVPVVGLALGGGGLVSSGTPTVGIAGVVIGSTIGWLVRSALLTRRRLRAGQETLQAIRALAREVNAGADLEAAVAALRASVGSGVSDVLGRLVGPTTVGAPPGPGGVGVALTAAVALSRRVGVPLAGLLDRLADGLADERQAADQRAAAVAGARLSGWVLAGLPLMGVLLGAGMGADPIPVLWGGGPGGMLLVAGTTLTCAGLLWSARIAQAPG